MRNQLEAKVETLEKLTLLCPRRLNALKYVLKNSVLNIEF